jgi:hydroxymethylbilane synthase
MNVDPQLLAEPVRIGTRGSDLALWQARHVTELLRHRFGAQLEVEIEVISTEGDRIQDRPLHEIGGKGLFVKSIEQKLLEGAVDLAVHSMKDLPARSPEGLVIGCTPRREDPRDALVGPVGSKLAKLSKGTRVGTGSLRRGALVRRLHPGVEVVPIRGNVPTRLAKVRTGEVDAVILAAAGLRRLGLDDHVSEFLEVDRFCPSPAQGILALQCRTADTRMRTLLAELNDGETSVCAEAERGFLVQLEAGCTVPVACHARLVADGVMTVSGLVVDPSGQPCFMASKTAHPREAADLGRRLADDLLALGAGRVAGIGHAA